MQEYTLFLTWQGQEDVEWLELGQSRGPGRDLGGDEGVPTFFLKLRK